MMEEKKALRKHIAQLKGSMDASSLSAASDRLFARLEQSPRFREARTILCYYSLPDEVATHDFVERWKDKKNILLPVVKGDDLELRREVYKSLCMFCDILRENRKDIPREEMVSFHEMEKCEDRRQIQEYGGKIILDIMKYLEAGKTGSRHGTILELLAYIDQHYNEDIGLNELADRVGMSPAYLSVLFKNEVGMSYVKYLTNLRISRAKDFLKEGRKVYEVSELVGYHNYRYFSDTFKKYVGQTPKAYTMQVWGKETGSDF